MSSYSPESKSMKKVRRGGGGRVRKDLCVFAREAKEVCKTERGYPASLPRHSCYICLCPLTHQRVGSTGHKEEYQTMTHFSTRDSSYSHTCWYSANTMTWLLMSCLYTKHWNGNLTDTYSVWLPSGIVWMRERVFHNDTSLVVLSSADDAQHESLAWAFGKFSYQWQ